MLKVGAAMEVAEMEVAEMEVAATAAATAVAVSAVAVSAVVVLAVTTAAATKAAMTAASSVEMAMARRVEEVMVAPWVVGLAALVQGAEVVTMALAPQATAEVEHMATGTRVMAQRVVRRLHLEVRTQAQAVAAVVVVARTEALATQRWVMR